MTEATKTEEQINPLEMADEDIEKMILSEQVPEEEPVEKEIPDETEDDERADAESAAANEPDGSEDEHERHDEDGEEEEADDEEGAEGEEEADDSEVELKPLTPEKQLEVLFQPFKANGHEMQVNNINDAIALMQMGANYNKKMAGLKPNLKLMKMLSNNDLLDEEKLSYLIDLDKKNPDAIQKLLKDSEIDPLDIDTDTDTEYKPGTYTVKENEVELDLVLDSIQDTPSFNETIDLISNKWDDSSKKVALDNPRLISTINDHVASGVYGEIAKIINNERAFGRLTELSDLEAYKHVGDTLKANGAFDTQPPAANEEDTSDLTSYAKQDPQLNKDRKKAAGSPRSSKKSKKVLYNPLAMSDEEFEKMAAPI